jgi:hypothetical protein
MGGIRAGRRGSRTEDGGWCTRGSARIAVTAGVGYARETVRSSAAPWARDAVRSAAEGMRAETAASQGGQSGARREGAGGCHHPAAGPYPPGQEQGEVADRPHEIAVDQGLHPARVPVTTGREAGVGEDEQRKR